MCEFCAVFRIFIIHLSEFFEEFSMNMNCVDFWQHYTSDKRQKNCKLITKLLQPPQKSGENLELVYSVIQTPNILSI
jgi:hypothetical protein